MSDWREDKFAVGDRVTWSDIPNVADLKLPEQYGVGPFKIERVEDEIDDFEWRCKSMGHTQYVWVNGNQYSGAYFRKVEL